MLILCLSSLQTLSLQEEDRMARRTDWHTTTRAAACKGSSLQCVDQRLRPCTPRHAQELAPWCDADPNCQAMVFFPEGRNYLSELAGRCVRTRAPCCLCARV